MQSRSNIIVIIAGVLVVAAIVAVGILPSYKKNSELDEKISQVELMEKLGPYSRAISLSLARSDKDLRDFIRSRPIPSEEVGGVTETFRKLAQKNGLSAEEINPDINQLDFSAPEKEDLVLTVHLALGGKLKEMQGFLVDCAKLPFFKSVDRIAISRGRDSLKMDATIKLSVSRKKRRA